MKKNNNKYYFPLDYYPLEKDKEVIKTLDDIMKEIEELRGIVEGIEYDNDLKPVYVRLDKLESKLEELGLDVSSMKVLLDKIDSEYVTTKDLDLLKETINESVSLVKKEQDIINKDTSDKIDKLDKKLNDKITEINLKISDLVTQKELSDSLFELKTEIILEINNSNGSDIGKLNELDKRLTELEQSFKSLENTNIDMDKQIKSIKEQMIIINDSIQEVNKSLESKVDLEQFNKLNKDVTELSKDVKALEMLKTDIENLKKQVQEINKLLENLNITETNNLLEVLNNKVIILEKHDLFNYWINLAENKVTNDKGELVVNEMLSLEDFITYLRNDVDYTDRFNIIDSEISDLNNAFDLLKEDVKQIGDMSEILERLSNVEQDVSSLKTLKDDFTEFNLENEEYKKIVDEKLDKITKDIIDLKTNFEITLIDYAKESDLEELSKKVDGKLLEMEKILSERYTNKKIDELLDKNKTDILNSIDAVTHDELDEALKPLKEVSDVSELKKEINELRSDFDLFKEDINKNYAKNEYVDFRIESLKNDDDFTRIPIATSTILGGIKVGEGLLIDRSGLLKVDSNFDANNYYNKPEIDYMFNNINLQDYFTKQESKDIFTTKVETKELDDKILNISERVEELEKGNVDIDLSEYEKIVDNDLKLDKKADKETTYTKTEVDTKVVDLETKIDEIDTGGNGGTGVDLSEYEKTVDVDLKLDKKSDKETTYTKDEVNTKIEESKGEIGEIKSLTFSDIGYEWNTIDSENGLTFKTRDPNASQRYIFANYKGSDVFMLSKNGLEGGNDEYTPFRIRSYEAALELNGGKGIDLKDNTTVHADLNVTGEKNAIHPTRKGVVKTPAMESSKSYITEILTLDLKEGKNEVMISDMMMDICDTTDVYHVFVQTHSFLKVYPSDFKVDRFILNSEGDTKATVEIKATRRGFKDKEWDRTEDTFEDMKELFDKETEKLKEDGLIIDSDLVEKLDL